MKFISICDRTGIVECEIFAAAYRLYGLNTIRYPVVQFPGEVKPFDNCAGYMLDVLRVERGGRFGVHKITRSKSFFTAIDKTQPIMSLFE